MYPWLAQIAIRSTLLISLQFCAVQFSLLCSVEFWIAMSIVDEFSVSMTLAEEAWVVLA